MCENRSMILRRPGCSAPGHVRNRPQKTAPIDENEILSSRPETQNALVKYVLILPVAFFPTITNCIIDPVMGARAWFHDRSIRFHAVPAAQYSVCEPFLPCYYLPIHCDLIKISYKREKDALSLCSPYSFFSNFQWNTFEMRIGEKEEKCAAETRHNSFVPFFVILLAIASLSISHCVF